ARLVTLAYSMDRTYGFQYGGDDYDLLGLGEKWFQGGGGPYYIDPSGGGYPWDAGTSTATLLPQVGTAYYDDPSTPHNADPSATPPVGEVSVSGTTLTISAGTAGDFGVLVTAKDRLGAAGDPWGGVDSKLFRVTVV